MSNNSISVIMSTYREEHKHLKQAIESVLNQTFSDFEFIIIADDPKNLELISILEKYRDSDSRIRLYINDVNMGLTYCRNKSIQLCNSEYIAIMDADDICAPDRFETQKKCFDDNGDVSVVFSGRVDIDENDDVIVPFKKNDYKDDNIKNMLKYCDIITNPTVMISKDSLNRVGGLRTVVCAEDYDLWLRCISMGFKFHYIDRPLLSYRIRRDSLSHKNYAKTWIGTKYAIKLYKQRKKSGSDNYSQENFENYVKRSLLGNENGTKRFNRAYDIYSKALEKRNCGKIPGALCALLHSILVHPEILNVFINSAKLKRCEKKQS